MALYDYPEKILAEITWHALEDFEGATLTIKGISPTIFNCPSISAGNKASFSFPVFGENEPLADASFTLLEGKEPLR